MKEELKGLANIVNDIISAPKIDIHKRILTLFKVTYEYFEEGPSTRDWAYITFYLAPEYYKDFCYVAKRENVMWAGNVEITTAELKSKVLGKDNLHVRVGDKGNILLYRGKEINFKHPKVATILCDNPTDAIFY